ncbi:MAG TPA: sigma-70 family RNA polymerase sigma factor, partial [Chloroflexi bacterium]|nr:sigma-70 family RNA polymerase sigma factor [Chloroflexota bacterium]
MTTTWAPDEALFRLSVANLAKTAPVSPKEERRLILEMVAGHEIKEILENNPPEDEQERAELEEKMKRSLKARETLIVSNGRLVISIANRYTGHGLTLAEVSQEGVLGLIRAIDKFDADRGVRLSTYASYWIRQSVSRAVAVQTRTIRLPVHKVDRLGAVKKATNQLTQQLGRAPEMTELAEALGDTPEQIEALLCDGQETLSLENPVGDDGATLADFVMEDDSSMLEKEVDQTLLEQEIQEALTTLTARESRIMELRYGLRDGHPLTLQDVAERFGLTRERIRQIEKEAIAKLRRPDKAFRLRAFV